MISEAVRRIRQHFNRPIPSILVTGDTAPERLREAEAAGLRLLHKPVKPAELQSVIAEQLRGAA